MKKMMISGRRVNQITAFLWALLINCRIAFVILTLQWPWYHGNLALFIGALLGGFVSPGLIGALNRINTMISRHEAEKWQQNQEQLSDEDRHEAWEKRMKEHVDRYYKRKSTR